MECTAHGGDEWREVTTDHFRIETNLSEEDAAAQAKRLEALRSGLLAVHQATVPDAQRLPVIILRDQDELNEFTDYSGYAVSGGIFVLAADDKARAAETQKSIPGWKLSSTLTHELTHELAHNVHSFVFVRTPRWVAEGLAGYEETLELNRDSSVATLGAEASANLQQIYLDGVLDLEDLWSWGRPEQGANESRLYASSWMWMHFFFNRRKANLEAFFLKLRDPTDPKKAFESVFGSDDEALRAQLDRYLEEKSYQMHLYPLPQKTVALSMKVMTPAQVHLSRSKLLMTAPSDLDMDERAEAAKQEVVTAAQLGPTEFDVRLQQVDLSKEEAAVEQLVRDFPDQAPAWLLLSEYLSPKTHAEERRKALRRAVELDPTNALALNNLAWDLATRGGDAALALEYAKRAVQAAPWSASYVDTLAASLAASNQCEQAYLTQLRATELLSEHAPAAARVDFQKRADSYKTDCGKKTAAPDKT